MEGKAMMPPTRPFVARLDCDLKSHPVLISLDGRVVPQLGQDLGRAGSDACGISRKRKG
jgi:hypothetical protein